MEFNREGSGGPTLAGRYFALAAVCEPHPHHSSPNPAHPNPLPKASNSSFSRKTPSDRLAGYFIRGTGSYVVLCPECFNGTLESPDSSLVLRSETSTRSYHQPPDFMGYRLFWRYILWRWVVPAHRQLIESRFESTVCAVAAFQRSSPKLLGRR